MSDPLKSTVAIVTSPKALEDLRSRLRYAGIQTSQLEISVLRSAREAVQEHRVPLVISPKAALWGAAVGSTLGLLIVAGWMGLISALAASLGAVGGAAFGAAAAVAGVAVARARDVPSRTVQREYWKIRFGGEASMLSKARALASRSGLTLRRVATGAFEVKRPPSKR